MIVERLVFQAKFGQGDAVEAAFKDFQSEQEKRFGVHSRLLVDVTGRMFTLVVETEYPDTATLVRIQGEEVASYGEQSFQDWFARWSPHVETGERQLYRVIVG